tara:strand:- start:107 stop:244 length:138 start_codon:yes stop_codon:yes gene_type:complete
MNINQFIPFIIALIGLFGTTILFVKDYNKTAVALFIICAILFEFF